MISEQTILNASILIVDDKQTNVVLLERMLRGAGYVSIASTMDPYSVCALHRDNHYDLILLDLQMPGMDGFQVMEKLKEIETGGYLPVLVITAHPDHKLRALAAGAKDFICSPFDLMEAKTRIHNMLEVRLLYQQLDHYSRAMESLALHDSLTKLPNRRLLMDRLAVALTHAHRNQHSMAVMFLDLDGFKQINDSLGHDAGDTLLKLVAARMVAAVRREDTVARLGGDEFVIVLWELNHVGGIAELASKLITTMSQPYSIQNHSVSITISVGISIYPEHGEEAKTLLKNADVALHEAKRAGKNDFRIAADTGMPTIAHNLPAGHST